MGMATGGGMVSSLPPSAFGGRFKGSEACRKKRAEGESSQSALTTTEKVINITYYANDVKRFGKISSSPAGRVSIR